MVKLDACDQPEFDRWRWVDYWHPLNEVVAFKREVYKKALQELAPMMPQCASHGSGEQQYQTNKIEA